MKRNRWIIAVIVIILIGWIITTRNNSVTDSAGTNFTSTSAPVKDVDTTTKPVSAQSYTYQGVNGKTVLDLLQEKYPPVETENSDNGVIVIALNGVKADSGKEHWSFYVNGVNPTEGADTYVTTGGDKIEWRLELLR